MYTYTETEATAGLLQISFISAYILYIYIVIEFLACRWDNCIRAHVRFMYKVWNQNSRFTKKKIPDSLISLEACKYKP